MSPSAEPTTTAPTTEPSESPWYFIVGDELMTWGEAEDWCLNNYGRHLVSIHNDSQNNAASDACDDCWIGATCKESDHGDFAWSDGSAWDYTMWNDDEPNDVGNIEDCVHQWPLNKMWNDEPCDNLKRPLCGNAGIVTL